MNRIERSQKKYEELFLNSQTLDLKGPEFMTQLQRLIFGEVFYVGDLTDRQRELITCSVLTVLQTLPQLKAHLNAALNVGVLPLELKESLYQCAPFIGYPRTLNAVNVLNEVLEDRHISLPLDNQTSIKDEERYEKGLEIQKELYGDEIKDRYRYLPDDVGEALPRFLTEWCFGDCYTRKVLDIPTRELLIFCILTALNASGQLYAHALGNIKVGNSLHTLYYALIQCLPYLGFPCVFNAFNAIKDLAE